MKVVIDCNVFISAGLTDGICRQVFFHALKKHTVFVSPEILREYTTVMNRKKFAHLSETFHKLLKRLQQKTVYISLKKCGFHLPDPTDKIYLDAAITAETDVLITGNIKHFPKKKYGSVRVLTPRQFFEYFMEREMCEF